MLDNLPNIFTNSVNDRLKSPLFGAFILSWIGWNWRIFYITFFIDNNQIPITKIEFIDQNYLDLWHILWYPIISTIIIIIFLPILQIGSFWIQENYKLIRDKLNMKIAPKKWLSPLLAKDLKRQYQNEIEEYENLIIRKDNSILKLIKEKNEIEDKLKINEIEIQEISKKSSGSHEDRIKSKPDKSIKVEPHRSNTNNLQLLKLENLNSENKLLKAELDSIKNINNEATLNVMSKDMRNNPEYLQNIFPEYNRIKQNSLFQILINFFRSKSILDQNFFPKESFDFFISNNLIKKMMNSTSNGNDLYTLSTKGDIFKAWYFNEMQSKN